MRTPHSIPDAVRRLQREVADPKLSAWVAANAGAGPYSKTRAQLHKNVLSDLHGRAGINPAMPGQSAQPTFTILGGREASGKEWFRGRAYDPAKALVLDADEIMAQLPEYEGWNAPVVRAEAVELLESALNRARLMGLNVVVDATLNSAEGAAAKIASFRAANYRVELHYMFVPRQTAAERAVARFDTTNHYVPIESILANTSNEATFDLVRDRVDAWWFYDNTGDEPVLVVQGPANDQPEAGSR